MVDTEDPVIFSIPMVGYRNDEQWQRASKRLRGTLQSFVNSDYPNYAVVITGHEKPDIEELNDSRVTFIEADFAKPADKSEYRRDKSRKRRRNYQWIKEQGGGLVFLADSDDLLHRGVIGFMRQSNHPFGHIIRAGYVFDMSQGVMAPVPGAWATNSFDEVCGTCVALRVTPDDIGPERYTRLIGGPSQARQNSIDLGRPLHEITWPAGVYVLGAEDTISVNVLRSSERQRQLQSRIAEQAIDISQDLIDGFHLQPLIDECAAATRQSEFGV